MITMDTTQFKLTGQLLTHRKSAIKNSEYDQEIPQSQVADNPWHHEEEPLNYHETAGRQIKQNNQISLPHQYDCNIRLDIK